MSTPSTPSTPPQSPPSSEAPRVSPAPPAPAKSRYSMGTLPNMLRSMVVIGLFVLALVAIVPRITSVQRPAVDATAKAGQVAAQTAWPVQLPKGLGEGWVPTVATYAPGTEGVPTFTTVWTTPGGKDIALKQAVGVTDGWVRRSVNDGASSGTVQVSGRSLERFVAPDAGQVAYVARGAGAKGLTLAASGTASEDELKAFVAALAPVAPAPGVSASASHTS
ncbi:MAG: DUF4245 domain-containing protein [Dermatophilaceae bacterium]|nr:DUF4245 domain-containing protein [Dermatophilaceae bacterium]NUO92347.1 DUF4245 domain-containing protein [Dermatophilaceae bacterium]